MVARGGEFVAGFVTGFVVALLLLSSWQTEVSLQAKSTKSTSSSTVYEKKEDLKLKNFVCEPSESVEYDANDENDDTKQAQKKRIAKPSAFSGYTPLLVMADPRVGSHLFFNLLVLLRGKSPPGQFDFHYVRELFSPSSDGFDSLQYGHTARLLSNSCQLHDDKNGGNGPNNTTKASRKPMLTSEELKSTAQENLQLLRNKSHEYPVLREWIEAFQHRVEDPMRCVDFLTRIPTPAKQAYVGFKIFNWHFFDISMSPAEFMFQLHDRFGTTKFVVIWRRRIIESLVSGQISSKTSNWIQRPSDANDAVTMNRTHLEKLVRGITAYYRSVHEGLRNLTAVHPEVEYEIIEYNRDLSRVEDQIRTMDRMQRFLNPLHDPINSTNLVEGTPLKKQAQVPLRDQVLNWDEVVEWGYGGEVEDWEDLFHEQPTGMTTQ